jgi:hypothetical protein
LKCDFRSTPINGHRQTGQVGPVRATTGLMHRSKQHRYSITSSARSSNVDGISSPSAFIELVAHSKLEIAGNDGDHFCSRVIVSRDLVSGRHLQPDHI